MGLFQQDVFDESLEDLIEAPEVDADQYAGDEDDGGARDHLLLAPPAVITSEQIAWALTELRSAIEDATRSAS